MLFKWFPTPNVYERYILRNTCNKFRVNLKHCMVFIQYYEINKLKGKRKKKMFGVQNNIERPHCKVKDSCRRKLSPVQHGDFSGTVPASALRSQHIGFEYKLSQEPICKRKSCTQEENW